MSALTRQDVLSEQEFLKAPPSLLCCTPYTNDVPRPSSSGVQLALFADDTALFYGNRNRSTDSPSSPQRAIDELGQWFRKWRIEVNPDKSAAIQFKYGVTLDKIYTSEIISSVLEILHFSTKQGSGPCSVKSKLSRRNKRTIYKMCIRTVMTYASPVFAHAAPKALHRLQGLRTPTISKYMKDASKRFFDIAGSHQCAPAAVDYQPPHPTTLSVGHETYLPIHLTLLQRQLPTTRPPLTASGRREKEPTRDGFLRHPMPRRLPPGVVHSACHAPSALACAVRPHSVKLSKSSDLSSDSSRPTK
ncbi:hypothetical protein EVAR_10738_1 [Eumeta japonica]|uniref:Uncharacterized protein n=1 Tax=Eumeta variegata TaxID=151549 RepID=A0A4C1W6S9_EUMVA|nr:hypothetical protein EVAR_10738_1 [Eumeta japonica]